MHVSVELNRKRIPLLLCVAAAMLGGGCSGINASKSVSPLDFFLPGLLHMRIGPPSPLVPASTNSVLTVADAN